jgi:hypothetical protein
MIFWSRIFLPRSITQSGSIQPIEEGFKEQTSIPKQENGKLGEGNP